MFPNRRRGREPQRARHLARKPGSSCGSSCCSRGSLDASVQLVPELEQERLKALGLLLVLLRAGGVPADRVLHLAGLSPGLVSVAFEPRTPLMQRALREPEALELR